MSGLYTELAKRRAEQSKEPVRNVSPLPPPEKDVVHTPQSKKATPARQQINTVTKPASLQPRKRAKLSLAPALSDSEMVEKYTTHVEPSLVKKLQIEAVERDINDYDVVRIALKEYFERNK